MDAKTTKRPRFEQGGKLFIKEGWSRNLDSMRIQAMLCVEVGGALDYRIMPTRRGYSLYVYRADRKVF